jgi:hypothetical protein
MSEKDSEELKMLKDLNVIKEHLANYACDENASGFRSYFLIWVYSNWKSAKNVGSNGQLHTTAKIFSEFVNLRVNSKSEGLWGHEIAKLFNAKCHKEISILARKNMISMSTAQALEDNIFDSDEVHNFAQDIREKYLFDDSSAILPYLIGPFASWSLEDFIETITVNTTDAGNKKMSMLDELNSIYDHLKEFSCLEHDSEFRCELFSYIIKGWKEAKNSDSGELLSTTAKTFSDFCISPTENADTLWGDQLAEFFNMSCNTEIYNLVHSNIVSMSTIESFSKKQFSTDEEFKVMNNIATEYLLPKAALVFLRGPLQKWSLNDFCENI